MSLTLRPPTSASADRSIILIGGGGHGAVVAEAASLAGMAVVGFLDDNPQATLATLEFRLPHPFPAPKYLGPMAEFRPLTRCDWIIAVGEIPIRRRIIEALTREGRMAATDPMGGPASVLHPAASVSPTATIRPGTLIAPLAVVHSRARVGPHAIVNSGAIVEHDCELHENVHLAPGAVLGGGVEVGADSLVGLGSRVLPGLRVGRGCTIGAGAVVTRDVADGMTVAGVPARAVPGR
ncbi:MAG: acetyltransferase [Phycisphaerales bacterium]